MCVVTCSVMVGSGGILECEGEDRSPALLSLAAIWGGSKVGG